MGLKKIRIFQSYSKKHDFCEKMLFWGCGWIEAASAVILLRVLCRKVYSFFSEIFTYVVFHIFSDLFDLTGTFQVQPLSGKGWWYVCNFDWYPKCPKWSALSRNVSIFVVPALVFRPLHPCLSLSLEQWFQVNLKYWYSCGVSLVCLIRS